MKLHFTPLVLALVAAPAFAALTAKEDRFNGSVTHSHTAKIDGSKDKFRMGKDSITLSRMDKGGESSHTVMIFTATHSNRHGGGWRYLHVRSVDWLVDGQPMQVSTPEKVSNVGRGYVSEAFIQVLTAEQMAAIGSAASVEFRIGSDEFKLSKADLEAARLLSQQ